MQFGLSSASSACLSIARLAAATRRIMEFTAFTSCTELASRNSRQLHLSANSLSVLAIAATEEWTTPEEQIEGAQK